jgi:KilA-N domain/Protein of unknown function (DUF3627)
MLSQITFEQIKDNFYYGAFRAIFDKSNGYVNATKMCASAKKNYYHWSQNKSSQHLIQTLQNNLWQKDVSNAISNSDLTLEDLSHGIPGGRSLVCKTVLPDNTTDVSNIISGTYVHSLLIPHIACWISADFALKVSEVINGYIVYEYKRKAEDLEGQLEITAGNVAKLEEVVAEKESLIESQQEAKEGAIQQCEAAKLVAHQQLRQSQQLETIVKQKKLELDTWGNSHAFVLLRTNSSQSKLPYYAIRRKRANMSGAIKKLRTKYPYSILVYQNLQVPNPVNLYNRLKKTKKLVFKGNYCNATIPEGDLINLLGKLTCML